MTINATAPNIQGQRRRNNGGQWKKPASAVINAVRPSGNRSDQAATQTVENSKTIIKISMVSSIKARCNKALHTGERQHHRNRRPGFPGTNAIKSKRMEVDVARSNRQEEKTGILASLDQSTRSRSVPVPALRAACMAFAALAIVGAALWMAPRGTQRAVRPPANASPATIYESPAEPQPETAAAIINEPAQAAPAKANTPAAQQPSTPAMRIPRQMKRGAPPHGAAPEDRDIALLAALVAHGSISDKDIVERYSGASTASLVQRCRRLGGTEGELCEARICSGAARSEAPCSAR
ncbi:hypothetical protein [Pseudoduganella rhizocola]|uniref:hypothetical protein n=1 Tax=Pseudoduganella rhizocola TaxID=3382643 RepID=UPI0038B55671